MKIKEFQQQIADALNGVESLIQGGCKAIAEDSLSVIADVEQQLQQAAGVAVVVTTPGLTRNGCAAGSIPCEARLAVKCIEIPALNRAQPGRLTALDAAEIVARILDGGRLNFTAMNQTADDHAGVLTVSIEFNTTIIINKGDNP